jgi:general secretion pathway protein D
MQSRYFQDAPLSLMLDYYADLMGKTILRAPGLQATVSLRTQGKVSAQEAADLIEGYLVMQNVALVENGDALKAVPASDVHHETTTIVDYDSAPPRETARGIMTRRFRLKTLTAAEGVQVFTRLKHPVGVIQPIEKMNAIIVTDTAPNLRKMRALLEDIDASAAAGKEARP